MYFDQTAVRQDPDELGLLIHAPDRQGRHLGFWAQGRCLNEGDTWFSPYMGEDYRATHQVQSIDDTLIIESAYPPTLPVGEFGATPTRTFTSIWSHGEPTPDRVTMRQQVGYEMRDFRFYSVLLRSGSADFVDDVHPKPSPNPVRAMGDVFPHLGSAGDFPLSFDRFVRYAEGQDRFREYMESHPNAGASWLRLVNITESQSQSWNWETIIRDDSTEALYISLNRRCFNDRLHQVVYGECQDGPGYTSEHGPGGVPEDGGRDIAVGAAKWWNATPIVRGDVALGNVQAVLQVGEPTYVEYTRYRGARYPESEAMPSHPTWIFGFDVISGDVDYQNGNGPMGTTRTIELPVAWTDSYGFLVATMGGIQPR